MDTNICFLKDSVVADNQSAAEHRAVDLLRQSPLQHIGKNHFLTGQGIAI